MKPVIEVRNIGKCYTINHKDRSSYSTIKDDVKKFIKSPFKKSANHNEQFWALKNISFDVMPGEVFGIIGKNGSGKSTMLKILSRIADPTEGNIKLHGKTASLLEVGTGFHPELTGRENIFFNGSMLGMSRKEIQRKFDEIVAFSGVEKFIDTPVKFYSSGMYVRLAFSVAAHLEPDILILDEVLAVGDVDFQSKSLAKIQSIIKNKGTTVLFVSHSTEAVRQLCTKGMLLEHGKIAEVGDIEDVLERYVGKSKINNRFIDESDRQGHHNATISSLSLVDKDGVKINSAKYKLPFHLKIDLNKKIKLTNVRFDLNIFNQDMERVACFSNQDITPNLNTDHFIFYVEELPLAPGIYTANVSLHQYKNQLEDFVPSAFSFKVRPSKDVIEGVSETIYLNGDIKNS
ncbi:ABC transporter ATP-binding protein [Candidatus Saccharibacteria bacterium]|nr:ABC transporter ATP-binding protein [Candidatus Saccharibacteria bacterium]